MPVAISNNPLCLWDSPYAPFWFHILRCDCVGGIVCMWTAHSSLPTCMHLCLLIWSKHAWVLAKLTVALKHRFCVLHVAPSARLIRGWTSVSRTPLGVTEAPASLSLSLFLSRRQTEANWVTMLRHVPEAALSELRCSFSCYQVLRRGIPYTWGSLLLCLHILMLSFLCTLRSLHSLLNHSKWKDLSSFTDPPLALNKCDPGPQNQL